MSFIKNITHEEVLNIASQVSIQEGQIVSKTLAQNPYVSLTLFAFSKGEEISTHDSKGDAMVLVLEGTGKFTVGRQRTSRCSRQKHWLCQLRSRMPFMHRKILRCC